jgi:hypothetical protein
MIIYSNIAAKSKLYSNRRESGTLGGLFNKETKSRKSCVMVSFTKKNLKNTVHFKRYAVYSKT